MRRMVVLGVLAGCAVLSATLLGQPRAQHPSIGHIRNVRDHLYVIQMSDPTFPSTFTGGNVAVFVTNSGVVLVDAKLPGYGSEILAQVKTVTDKPVTMIINSHTHNDHTGSDVEFPATVEVVAHENTRANLARTTCAPVVNCQSFKGENAKYLPKRTFKDKLTIGSGRDQIDLYYFGRAHTNGDTFTVFPSVRAMHTGDAFQRKNMPSIDVAPDGGGGSAVEFASTLAKAATGIKNVDTVIPGHFNNGTMTFDDFKEGVAFYQDFLATVDKYIAQGKTLEQAQDEWAVPERFKYFGVDLTRTKGNIAAIYAERSKK